MQDTIIYVDDRVALVNGRTGTVTARPAPGLATVLLDTDDWEHGSVRVEVPTRELRRIP